MSLTCHFVFEETLYRTFHSCFLSNFNWFGHFRDEPNALYKIIQWTFQSCLLSNKKKVSNGLREKDFKRHFSVKSYVKLCTAMACNGRHLEFFRPPTKWKLCIGPCNYQLFTAWKKIKFAVSEKKLNLYYNLQWS